MLILTGIGLRLGGHTVEREDDVVAPEGEGARQGEPGCDRSRLSGDHAEHLQRIRPELVYAQASAWGGIWGSTDPPLGTDCMVQAHSGLAEVIGRPGSPRPSLMTLLDLLGAHMCVEGVLAGLAHRYLDGRGRRVESSLLGAADEPLPLAARSATGIDALCRAVGVPAPTHPRETAGLRARLTPLLHTLPAGGWLDRLHTAGVPAAVVRTDLTALPADPRLTAHHGCAVVTSPWRFS